MIKKKLPENINQNHKTNINATRSQSSQATQKICCKSINDKMQTLLPFHYY